ncbi:HAMP domain-containing sensor histidine kinase [Sphaerisporangium sp. B11E5]|uniref:sensor histidine kinase n=1 Tax=Sphaerisporangium sp. B11E5 TaxID=3153563 RepID=UPI00325F62EE
MRLQNCSLRGRLALFTGMAVGSLCVVFSVLLMFAVNRLATQNLVKEVTAVGELTAYYVDRGELVNPLPPISHDLIRPVQVVDPRGRVVAATPDLQRKPIMADFAPEKPERVASALVCDAVLDGGECHVVVAQQVYRGGDWTIYSAAPALPFYVYPGMTLLLLAGTAVFTVAAAYGARHTVSRSLKPVDAIRSELDHIQSSDIARRVPVPAPHDEIQRLALSVNQTLDRLEDVLEQQRRFCADASHELRTPITAIRAQMESALLAPEDTDPSVLCNAVLPSVDRLQAIASDLLTLTRLDAGVPCERQVIDLADLVSRELKTHPPAKKVVHDLPPGVTVLGDPARLSQLVGNLIQNAARHASSTVTITVRRTAAPAAELEVLDDGPGIAAPQREIVFQRFTRLDTARSREAGGVGLGLPIARLLAEAHGGTLTLQDSPQGARFVLTLPLRS